MAEFEFEQLKTLFENLGDRIDRTKGDQITNAELAKIRAVMSAMSRQMADRDKNNTAPDPKPFINEFWRQWNSNDPMRAIRENTQDNGRSIIDRLQEQQNDIADLSNEQSRAGRGFLQNVNNFNKKLGEGSDNLGKFVQNLKTGGLLAASGGFVGKMFSNINSYIDGKANDIRGLMATSEGSITSIQELNNAVNSARMSTQELTKAMAEGSASARKLGALRWTTLTKALTDTGRLSKQFGLSFEMRQEAQDAFLDILDKQGNLKNLSESQMAQGIENLVKSSSDTAHILGISQKEARDAARARAENHNLNAVIRSQGLNNDTVNRAMMVMNGLGGPLGEKLLTEVIATRGGGPTSKDTATAAAVNPQMLAFARSIYQQMQGGREIAAQDIARQANAIAQQTRASGQSDYMAQLALTAGDNLNPLLAGAFNTNSQAADAYFNDTLNKKVTDEGTQAALNKEEIDRARITAFNEAVDSVANTIMNTYGKELLNLSDITVQAFNRIQEMLRGVQSWPTTVSTVSLGFIALAGTVGALNTVFKGLSLFRGLLGAGGAATAAAGAAGATGAAGTILGGTAGAAGAAGAGGAGLSILQRLKNAGGSLGGRAIGGIRDFAGSRAGSMVKGGLGIGALLEGAGYLFGNKEFSAKNLAKSGLRLGGGALGGILGSFAGPLGTVAGGAGGAWLGDWVGDKLLGADDIIKPANAGNVPTTNNPQARQARQTPANATPAQRAKATLTMDQMTSRIMDHSERSVGYLKTLKEQGERNHDLMREEIAVMRAMSERISRLLEDGNKNTRTIADNSI